MVVVYMAYLKLLILKEIMERIGVLEGHDEPHFPVNTFI